MVWWWCLPDSLTSHFCQKKTTTIFARACEMVYVLRQLAHLLSGMYYTQYSVFSSPVPGEVNRITDSPRVDLLFALSVKTDPVVHPLPLAQKNRQRSPCCPEGDPEGIRGRRENLRSNRSHKKPQNGQGRRKGRNTKEKHENERESKEIVIESG